MDATPCVRRQVAGKRLQCSGDCVASHPRPLARCVAKQPPTIGSGDHSQNERVLPVHCRSALRHRMARIWASQPPFGALVQASSSAFGPLTNSAVSSGSLPCTSFSVLGAEMLPLLYGSYPEEGTVVEDDVVTKARKTLRQHSGRNGGKEDRKKERTCSFHAGQLPTEGEDHKTVGRHGDLEVVVRQGGMFWRGEGTCLLELRDLCGRQIGSRPTHAVKGQQRRCYAFRPHATASPLPSWRYAAGQGRRPCHARWALPALYTWRRCRLAAHSSTARASDSRLLSVVASAESESSFNRRVPSLCSRRKSL